MFLSIPVRKFNGEETLELESEVKHDMNINRLYVPSNVAIDFHVLGARILRKGGGEYVLQPDGAVPAVLFSEVSFHVTPANTVAIKGDVVVTKLKNVNNGPRRFEGAWDYWSASTPTDKDYPSPDGDEKKR